MIKTMNETICSRQQKTEKKCIKTTLKTFCNLCKSLNRKFVCYTVRLLTECIEIFNENINETVIAAKWKKKLISTVLQIHGKE